MMRRHRMLWHCIAWCGSAWFVHFTLWTVMEDRQLVLSNGISLLSHKVYDWCHIQWTNVWKNRNNHQVAIRSRPNHHFGIRRQSCHFYCLPSQMFQFPMLASNSSLLLVVLWMFHTRESHCNLHALLLILKSYKIEAKYEQGSKSVGGKCAQIVSSGFFSVINLLFAFVWMNLYEFQCQNICVNPPKMLNINFPFGHQCQHQHRHGNFRLKSFYQAENLQSSTPPWAQQ